MARDNPSDNSSDFSSKHAPRLSVLMTTYNSERFLSSAIISILEQTFTDFEFIIVDDGSRDGSAALIRSFCARDSRMRGIFLRENVGIPRAANIGLGEVRAGLVARMDSDDICAADRFARQVAYMDKYADIYMLGCRAVNIDEFGNNIEEVDDLRLSFVMGSRQIAARMGDGDYPLVHASLIYRTAAVLSLGGYREIFPIGEDLDLFERMFIRYGCVFANLRNGLYFYRRYPSSLSYIGGKYSFKQHYWISALIRHSSDCCRHDLADPLDAVKHLPFPPLSSSKEEFIIMELVFYLHTYRNLLYKSVAQTRNLQSSRNNLQKNSRNNSRKNSRRLRMIMAKLSRLPNGSKTRALLAGRFFLLLLANMPSAKDERVDFLASFDDALFKKDGFFDSTNYCDSCLFVARGCLSFGERKNFMRYMFMAFRINFVYTLRFIFVRSLAYLIK